jgi:superkiller protein 3
MPIYPVADGQKGPSIPTKLPHVYHLAGSLALVFYILIHVQGHIRDLTESKVKQGRMRIGARSEREVRRQVDADVLGGPLGSTMVDLLRDVSSHPAVDEAVRRDVEVQEFKYWCKLVVVLP